MAIHVDKALKTATHGAKLWSILWKWSILIIIVLLVFINALIIGIDQGPMEGVKYLGFKFLSPTQDLNQASVTIIENGNFWWINEGGGFWSTLGNTIITHSLWISSLFIIFYYLKILAWIWKKGIIQDDSKTTAAWAAALITFIFLQLVVLGGIAAINPDINTATEVGQTLALPFTSFWNFMKALKIIFVPLAEKADGYLDGNATEIVSEVGSACAIGNESLCSQNDSEGIQNVSETIELEDRDIISII